MVSKALKSLTIFILLALAACVPMKQQQGSGLPTFSAPYVPAYPPSTTYPGSNESEQPKSMLSQTASPLPSVTRPLPTPTDTPQDKISTSTPPLITILPLTGEVSFTYDSERGRLLAFGGRRDQESITRNETWVGDAQSWIQLQPVDAPPARMAAGLVYDVARKAAILFGGVEVRYVGKELQWATLQDTWLWDGKNWIEQHPAVSPPPRRSHQMVYDSSQQEVLLFGGTQDGEAGSQLSCMTPGHGMDKPGPNILQEI